MVLYRVGDLLPNGVLPTHLASSLELLTPPASSSLDFLALALDSLMQETGFTRTASPSRGERGKSLTFNYRLLADQDAVDGRVGLCTIRVYSVGPTVLVFGQ